MFEFTYWNGNTETVKATDVRDAVEMIYGPITETMHTSEGCWYEFDAGSAKVYRLSSVVCTVRPIL